LETLQHRPVIGARQGGSGGGRHGLPRIPPRRPI